MEQVIEVLREAERQIFEFYVHWAGQKAFGKYRDRG